jgi:putative tryptophan/tyrosine transport system substrate-binding protein
MRPRAIRIIRTALRPSCRGSKRRAGQSAATCGSTIAGAGATRHASATTWRNWLRSHRMSSCGTMVAPLLQVTRTVPIVFVNATDPVGGGFVESMARPGGNATGFTLYEYSMSGKWLELLKQIAPSVTRVAVLRDAGLTSGGGQLGVLQGAAQSFGVELSPVGVRTSSEIERGITAFARGKNGGLIVTSSSFAGVYRDLIVSLAAKHRLPAVYSARTHVTAGGLMSYGADPYDQYRRAAGYIDRILKGEKPADLPVQQSTKYELVINLQTARALGIEVPPGLLASADEVIE